MTAPRCEAQLFDGRRAAAQPVSLWIEDGRLHVQGANECITVPVRRVHWPERQRHGRRLAYLPDGALLSSDDAQAWDDWARASGQGPSVLVGWMQSWRWVMVAALTTVALLGAAYRWGTPWVAQGLLAVCPLQVDTQIGDAVLAQFERQWLLPSRLPADTQSALRGRFESAVRHAPSNGPALPWTLHFRATPDDGLGANAFALPGGHIIVTDAMVKLLEDRPDALVAVLGHEWGHVQRRHGMRSLVQASLLAALSAAVVGDVSSALTAAPAVLGQLAYSREFEQQADDDAAALMRANGLDPTALALLFERLQAQHPQRRRLMEALPIALSSHPPDAERMRRLREGAPAH
jgi:predicted Zn-dependent protease